MALKPTSQHLLRCKWGVDERFPLPLLLRIMTGVAEALEHCHSRHIAHGDVYAHNVLVDAEGKATLCDFGEKARHWQGMKHLPRNVVQDAVPGPGCSMTCIHAWQVAAALFMNSGSGCRQNSYSNLVASKACLCPSRLTCCAGMQEHPWLTLLVRRTVRLWR